VRWIDLRDYTVKGPDCYAPLTGIEASVAYYLYSNAGRVVSQRELMRAIWNDPDPVDTTCVRMVVSSIRAKAGPDVIITRPRLGYMWNTMEQEDENP
jgi:DNA-binding response OmpR family regulator